ncbi:MAG: RNA polymerase sigma factor [Lentisphaeraceae bacterium]|nr:RNA polymerase sigma factor [Lentisphaeraceae bacterium]
MSSDMTRLTLIQKLQEECNEASWDEFISIYKGYLFVIFKKMSFTDADCHDLMQKTFLKVWKNVQSFEHGGRNGQFRRWLARIARNTALNYLVKSQREREKTNLLECEKQHEFLSSISDPEIDKIADKEWSIYISNLAWENISSEINDSLKKVFKLSMENHSRTEISEMMDIPPNTVSVYKRRVLSILQKEIKRLEESFG